MIRLKKELESLNDDEQISMQEMALLLGVSYQRLLQRIHQNRRDYKNSTYNIDLSSFITKQRVNDYYQRSIIKANLKHFADYIEYRNALCEVNRNKIAYRKAMQKHFGLESIYTYECSQNDFNCDKCINKPECSLYKSEINIKQLTKMINILFHHDNAKFSRNLELEIENNRLKQEIMKLKKIIIDGQIKLSELTTENLKIKKDILNKITQ